MFPAQIPRTDPGELLRCRDLNQLMVEEQKGDSENTKTDAALAHEVDRALWKDDVLRAVDYYEIDVRVKNGVVYLDGHIASTTSQNRIENAIRDIPGLLGIKNGLVLDDQLTLEVATSLGNLEHIYGCKFFTGVSHGVVSLNGTVSDENVKLLAEKCAAGNPNVRGVINNMRVPGTELGLQDQPFLQPTVGEIIYFLDGISGVVKQVIMNPSNRRVIQVIIQGELSGQTQDLRALTNNQARILEKTVVIPVNLIRYLTKGSGFLTIKSTETTRYEDFNPLDFTAPKMDWTPPYPYCPEDVLFSVEYQPGDNKTENLPTQVSSTLKTEEKVLSEDLLANDSLGG